jgi:hypothetical protein
MAVVALVNKNARIAWVLLAHDWKFRTDYAVTQSVRLMTMQ